MMTNVEKKSLKQITKRRLASERECLFDLKNEMPLFFKAFEEACENYNKEIIYTPPEARCRGFEASLFNSKLIQGIQLFFPLDWKYGKYKRFILNAKGYLVLFKKLNNKGMPMNVRTKIVETINYQMMGSLFEQTGYTEDPILYFGYKKDRLGNIYQPQLVYIDENQVRWAIEEKDVVQNVSVALEKTSIDVAVPKLRILKKKAVNE